MLSMQAPAPGAEERYPVPRFVDPERRARLASAFPAVEQYLAEQMVKDHIPGLAFGIVVDGELVHGKGLGVRDVSTQAPVDLDTVFRIASMTKSFTALAILKLRDEGRLSLDDHAARYVPELASLVYPTADSAPITIRQLLSHSEGFPEDNPWGDRQLAASDEAMSRMLRGGIPFSNPPGTAYEYSNYGFAILGQVVARVSGMRYRDYVDAQILRPLGLASTRWEAAAVPPARLAVGYRHDGGSWSPEPPLDDGAFGAMGGLFTSGHDLARYVAFLLSAWPPRDDPDTGPVRRSSVREMQQAWRHSGLRVDRPALDTPLRAAASAYGFGIGVSEDCRFQRIVAHSGGLPGFGSNMRLLPDHGVAAFILANRTYAPASAMAREATEILARTGALLPRARPPSAALLAAQAAVLRLLERWDEGEARAAVADNFFLDRSAAERAKELSGLHSEHGTCRAEPFEVENWLRGRFRASCDRGWLDVELTLAPTSPPRIQFLRIRSGQPLDERLRRATETLARLTSAWSEAEAGALAASGPDLARLRAQVGALGAQYGSCRVGAPLDGDGVSSARVRWLCERGSVDATVEVDRATGRLVRASFASPPEATCVP